MSLKPADIRDSILLALGGIAGAVLAPALPMVGFPLCALSIGGFVFRSRPVGAAIAVLVMAVVAGSLRSVDAASVFVAGAGIVVAAHRLRKDDVYATGLWLAPLIGLGLAASEFAAARLAGQTITEYFAAAASEASALLGTSGTLGGVSAEELTATMVRFAPSVYLLLGAVAVVPVLGALVWYGKRLGAQVRPVPPLRGVDLTPHVLWLLVAGIAVMAAGRVWGGVDGVVWAVGANLLVAVRLALLVQGLGLVAALLSGAGLAGPALGAGVFMALVVDSATWVVGLFGLTDFWVNFRKLDRGGEPGRTEGPATGS